MITAVVQFKLTEGTSLDDATAIMQGTAPRYRGMPGLVRKYYLFETRDAAEAVFDDAWRALIKEKYGAEPSIDYFETPVVVDNVSDEIIGAANVAAE